MQTGKSGRRRFDEYASTEWRRALRERAPFGLLLVDVDEFKPYNDANGHLAGDELLRRIGEAIRQIHTRERLGGLLKFYYREAA